MRYVGIAIMVTVVIAIAAVGGFYTASRLGNPTIGIAFGLGFVAIFAVVLWRALRANAD